MYENDNFREQIYAANPIIQTISQYSKLKKAGSVYQGFCPFHTEKNASLTVYPNDNSFFCFSCKTGGDVICFIQHAENLPNYYSAMLLLAERSGIKIPEKNTKKGIAKQKIYEINRKTANFYYNLLLRGNNKKGLEYLVARGIKAETVKTFGLGFADWDGLYKHLRSDGYSDEELLTAGVISKRDSGQVKDFFVNRIIFPIVDFRGNVIAFGGRAIDKAGEDYGKYKNSSETPAYVKGDNLFSLNLAKAVIKENKDTVIICEGYMDVVSLYQAGFKNCVASLGTSLTISQARLLSQYAKNVIINYDADNAGQVATEKAVKIFTDVGIIAKVLNLPDCKDPDEYIKKHGATAFKILVEHAGDAIMFEIDRCKEGLKMDEPSGRTECLRRCINVLKEINDNTTRSTYISIVAGICGVLAKSVEDGVNAAIRKKQKAGNIKQWREVKERVTAPPSEIENPYTFKAERSILHYMLIYPEKNKFVAENISEEYFLSPVYRKIFTMLLDTNAGLDNIMILSEYLSSSENSKLFTIKFEMKDIAENDDTLTESIATLKKLYKKYSNRT